MHAIELVASRLASVQRFAHSCLESAAAVKKESLWAYFVSGSIAGAGMSIVGGGISGGVDGGLRIGN